jgi:hypothetical protein
MTAAGAPCRHVDRRRLTACAARTSARMFSRWVSAVLGATRLPPRCLLHGLSRKPPAGPEGCRPTGGCRMRGEAFVPHPMNQEQSVA